MGRPYVFTVWYPCMEVAIEILTMCVLGWFLGHWIYAADMIGGVVGSILGFALALYSLYRKNTLH